MDLYSVLRTLTRQTGEQGKSLYQFFCKRNFCFNSDSAIPKAIKEFNVYTPALVTSTEAAFRPYNNMIYDLFYGPYRPIHNSECEFVSVPLTIIMFLITRILCTDPLNMTAEKGGDTTKVPGRIGSFDAASEAGFFHKTDTERLKDLKKTLADAPEDEDEEQEEPELKPKGKGK